MSKLKMPISELVNLYEGEKRSTKELAQMNGMTDGGIRFNLRKAGCVLRTDARPDIASDELVKLYEGGLSPERMSAQVGLSVSAIRYRLRQAGCSMRGTGWGTRKTPTAELARLYFDERMSLDDIAKQVGMEGGTIGNRLRRARYALRPPMMKGWINPKTAATRVPRHEDIAWAAGIYEGEGSVVVPKSGYGSRRPAVSLVQKDDWLCNELRSLFGGTVRVYGKKNGQRYNYWRLTGVRATAFLLVIFKFLSPRRQQQIQSAYNPVVAVV